MGKNKREKRHEELKKRIKERPGLIGLHEVQDALEEKKFYKERGKEAYVADLIFHAKRENSENYEFFLIEVKGSGIAARMKKALRQLCIGRKYFYQEYGRGCNAMVVYPDPKGNIKCLDYTSLKKKFEAVLYA